MDKTAPGSRLKRANCCNSPDKVNEPRHSSTLTITRTFAAPRIRVFDAWTNPNSDIGWWVPKNFTKQLQEIHLQVGGRHRLGKVSPEGEKNVSGGVYREIVPPQRLVMTEAWEDADDKPGHEKLVTITLDERDDKTEMVFVQTGFDDAASRDGHREGWSEAFDALAAAFARRPERST